MRQIRLRGKTWWIRYYRQGNRHEEWQRAGTHGDSSARFGTGIDSPCFVF